MRHEGRTVEVDFTSGSVVRQFERVEVKGRGAGRETAIAVWKLTGADSDGQAFELVKP
jgi:hypothetical protein